MVLLKCRGLSRLCHVPMVGQYVFGWGSEISAGKNTQKKSTVGG